MPAVAGGERRAVTGGERLAVAGEETEAGGGRDEVQGGLGGGEEEGLAGGEGGAVHGAGAGGAGDREPAPAARGRAAERSAELEERRREVRALHELHRSVRAPRIMRPVVVTDRVVNGFFGQLGMELTRLAVKTWTVVVEDAIGDVAALLYFCHHCSAADGMDTTGWDEEHVAFLHIVALKHVGDGAVFYAFMVFVFGNGTLET